LISTSVVNNTTLLFIDLSSQLIRFTSKILKSKEKIHLKQEINIITFEISQNYYTSEFHNMIYRNFTTHTKMHKLKKKNFNTFTIGYMTHDQTQRNALIEEQ
jgi:hypothetical protein